MLGTGIPRKVVSSRVCAERYTAAWECRCLLDAFSIANQASSLNSVTCWQAPAPYSDKSLSPNLTGARYTHENDTSLRNNPHGWEVFHKLCCTMKPTPFRKEDWAVFRELGFGFWSRRRLADELRLVSTSFGFVGRANRPKTSSGKSPHLSHDEITYAWWALCKAHRGWQR